ncbi:hypothetical protein NLG97_g6458 [Lecanicillium saksenae]|uniref:Uncharacterized protein n=1 Tax=Lecanicillium saksenae TaxID=468837 RepID=A0ACC1QTE1_9HYPO|nr:hypothetical protein NLG97_g6458 [Lecanicillium saksenae]
MVDKPEKAAYIIVFGVVNALATEWTNLENLRAFQSSEACVEFLRNLPENANTAASGDIGVDLKHPNLNKDSISTATSPARSRFRVLRHAFSVPNQIDEIAFETNFAALEAGFGYFRPRNHTVLTRRGTWTQHTAIWLHVLEEDSWVEQNFGPAMPQQDYVSRTIILHAFLWKEAFEEPYEKEAAAMADLEAMKSWQQRATEMMPPATAWVQERWDIRQVPFYDTSSPDKYCDID